ncbi:MAG: transposase, partial [Gammaproteobacteria bacterium]|nr:transposase [Gammaproteobacteria bacterium]
KLFWDEIESAFRQVLRIAAGMKLVKFGVVSLDGTKIKANASKHSALSYGHAQKLETQIQAEIAELKRRAEAAEGLPDDLSLPAELQRREDRLEAIRKAKADIEARAAQRDAPAQAEYEAKVQAREVQRQQGKKPKGKEPQPPQSGPKDRDQINLTDPESRILPAGSDFVQGYNAQAAVDAASMLILAYDCVQATNDKQQLTPMLDPLKALPQQIGLDKDTPIQLAADTGYFSEANVQACEAAQIKPLIASKRESHSGWLDRRLASPPVMPNHPTALDRMRDRLATPEGKADYGLRKCTVEPTFGIIKQVMRFRQFLVRGLKNVQAEWGLVCLAFNLKRMAVLSG